MGTDIHTDCCGTDINAGGGGRDITVCCGGTDIHTDCWDRDINAGCGSRDIAVAVGAQIYTLIVVALTSTLGVGAGTYLWLWGHRYTH